MGIDEYKARVKELFTSGQPTQAQWEEMAEAILKASEDGHPPMTEIDKAVLPINETDPDVAEYGHDPAG